MSTPSLYVWDCSNAGIVVQNFLQFEIDRENEVFSCFSLFLIMIKQSILFLSSHKEMIATQP